MGSEPTNEFGVTTSAASNFSGPAEAIGGKFFPKEYVYFISASSLNSSSVNGVSTYFGSVAGFTQSSTDGSFSVNDAEKGTVSYGGKEYFILGSSSNGQFLVLGTQTTSEVGGITFTSMSPSLLISNSGAPPEGTLTFNTSNPYSSPNPPCFAGGTWISTPQGEVMVENLRVGDCVLTPAGEAKPIKWIGKRWTRVSASPWASAVTPIRIRRDAIAPGVPTTDLVVSPGHCLVMSCIGEVLIPAAALVNGMTIVQDKCDSVTYWHVELENHCAIIANGCAAETYLDAGNRDQFEAGNEIVQLAQSVDGPIDDSGSFLPRLSDGVVVDAIRAQLIGRARVLGWTIEETAPQISLVIGEKSLQHSVLGQNFIRFLVPVEAGDAVLTCNTFVPMNFSANSRDTRSLGIKIAQIHVTDGASFDQVIEADDERLSAGFHYVEHEPEGPRRWTSGDTVLPSTLWAGAQGHVFIKVIFSDAATFVASPPDNFLAAAA